MASDSRTQFKDTQLGAVPNEWKVASLDECILPDRPICYGILKPGKGHAGGVPVVKVKNIKGGRILEEDLLLTSPEIDEQYRRSGLRSGDILLTIRGTTGRVAIVPHSLDGANITQDTARLSVRPEALPGYVFYALQSPLLQNQIRNETRGQAVKGINIRDVRLLCLPIPPLPEQRKIAAILSSVDAVIEKTEAVIEQLQVVKKAMMQELLTRGLPGRHTRFKQTEIGEIPEEWEVVALGHLSELVTSGSRGWAKYYAEDGPPFIRITNLIRGSIDLDLRNLMRVSLPEAGSEGKRTRLECGDLLISITADLGITALVRDDLGEAYVNQHIALVRVGRASVEPEFLAHFLTSESAQSRFRKLNDAGAKAGLNLPSIRRTPVALPSHREQREIKSGLTAVDRLISFERANARELNGVKAALMSVLLTGEVRVTPDEEAA